MSKHHITTGLINHDNWTGEESTVEGVVDCEKNIIRMSLDGCIWVGRYVELIEPGDTDFGGYIDMRTIENADDTMEGSKIWMLDGFHATDALRAMARWVWKYC